MAAHDHTGRSVTITELRGHSEWIGEWKMLCVEQSDTPLPCTVCDKAITDIKDLGAWKLHTASPICTECLEKYKVAEYAQNS
jgi:hypothetical protein